MVVLLRKEVFSLRSLFGKRSVRNKTDDLSTASRRSSNEENAAVLVPHLFQDNVFVEGSRHKYVEDLHSEAQQGLKLKQLEENKMDTDYTDSQSIISGVTSQNEGGSCGERRKSIGSESTATDSMSTVSTQSTISSRSTRSALSRQGSTFTPLNLGKKERPKGRRKHRRSTVMGIPRHVQKELGLDRALWTAYQRSQEPVPNQDFTDMPGITLSTAPAADRPVPPSGSEQQKAPCFPEQRPKDDLALIQTALPPQAPSTQRPMSLAVPWATTAAEAGAGGSLQPPSSPVMYISPQGMYLSKLIPNAVLPPSVDVVEINRNRSRSSVRTVSKCSLASASPAPSRTSSRASSSRRSARPSESSGWSRSDSSETLVSDSSTISSSSTARPPSSGRDSVVEVRPAKAGAMAGGDGRPNGQVKTMMVATAAGERDQPLGQFTRSLSVMKRTKKPPPPSRSYSLHKDKMKRRSRDLAEAKIDFSGVTPKSVKERTYGESPGYSADESAVEESFSSGAPSPPSTQHQASREGANSIPSPPLNLLAIEKGLKRNLSPSSGYSSHNGTPHSKELRLPSAAAGDQKHANKTEVTGLSSNHTKPAVLALKALFEIPQPPKVTAPPPPPPEVWAHNQRTFVLLCGPGPANIKFATPPSPKRPQPQQVKGETPSAEVPSGLSGDNRGQATAVVTEQDSSSVSKRLIPAPPNNPSLMQELLKAQHSLDKRDQSQIVSGVKQVADIPAGPPLSPPLPPPPPAMLLDPTLDQADLPPPPPLFSPTSPSATAYQAIPAGIPPPPLQPPPPPPQHPPPPPPPVAMPASVPLPPPKEEVSCVPPPPAAPDIPKPPPLPVDLKPQPPPVTFKSLRKAPPPQKKEPPKTNDDSASPVVTPSILQKVRLRSIKSHPKPESSVTEVTSAEPTEQKSATSHVAPPKPIRRSLLLAEPPPDVAAVIAAEAKSSSNAAQQASETEAAVSGSPSHTPVVNPQSAHPVVTSEAETAVKNSEPDTTVVSAQSEQPAETPQLGSTDSKVADSKHQSEPQSEVTDSKPLPGPSASVLESQPEAKKVQSNIELDLSSPVPDSQAPAQSLPDATVSKAEAEQADSKPKQLSAPAVSEPHQTKETSIPDPPTVDSGAESTTSATQKLQVVPAEAAAEQVAQNAQAPDEESERKPGAEVSLAKNLPAEELQCHTSAVAVEQVAPSSKPHKTERKTDAEVSGPTTEQTEPEMEPVATKKPEPEQIPQTSLAEPSVPPAASDTLASTPDQNSNLPVNQAKDQTVVSKSDNEPSNSTGAAELNAAESKADIPSLSSESEPGSSISKAEPESVVLQTLPTAVESNSEPVSTVSTSESISKSEPDPKPESTPAAAGSTPLTTTAAPTAATSTPTTVASKPTITVSAPLANSAAPNTTETTHKPVSPTSPTARAPPGSVASPSMRLQEAIRQRAAARSAADGPAKRLSLHSPPASVTSGALKSPTSTASFIFSKSNKKPTGETSTAPQVQPGLKKTAAQTESPAAAPSQPKQGDGLKTSKVPPPVASKPRAKVQGQKNGIHSPSAEEGIAAEEVQTAGQSAPSEDTRNTA